MGLHSFGCFNSGSRRSIFVVISCLAILYFYQVLERLNHERDEVVVVVPSRLPRPHPPADDDEYIAFCLAVKNQARDLPEFLIHHYYNLGIRRFYIMDDRSIPPLSTVADYGIPSDTITFQYNDIKQDTQWMQYAIYNKCAERFGSRHTWLAFIDADEFFEVKGNDTLRSMLEEFGRNETIGAVGVNWRIHTSSGLLTRPVSARKSFTNCIWDDRNNTDTSIYKDNKLIKSIVKSSAYSSPINPHQFHLKNKTNTVGEHGDVVAHVGLRMPISRQRIALHHYAIKSQEEFEEKMNRSNAMGQAKGWEYWDHLEGLPQRVCREMTNYEP